MRRGSVAYQHWRRMSTSIIYKGAEVVLLSYGFGWLFREMYGEPEIVYQLGFTLATLFVGVFALGTVIFISLMISVFLTRATTGSLWH